MNTADLKSNNRPLSVVIIGGSLAGLMHGIMLKRRGHNVQIMDQTMSSARADQAAGMGTGPQGLEFLDKHDLCSEPYSFKCPGFQFLNKNTGVRRYLNIPLNLTSWNALYYRLRANFDSFPSSFCLDPPLRCENEGMATYDVGKRATKVIYVDHLVTVEYEDKVNGGAGSTHADLVIVADGAHSTIRQQLLPNVRHHYSGYVAWRGTVPEKEVSEDTRKLFDKRFNVYPMDQGYIVGYSMPGKDGTLAAGERLLNWVWYFNCPKSNSAFDELMTDIDGHKHQNTLPIGKMRPETWQKQQEHANRVLNPPFLELVSKTTEPFISSVNDCAATQASCFDGRLLLVGEALTLLRPHTGMSFNHAAVNCLLLKKALDGEMSVAQWEREVLRYAERTKLLSICVGCYYQAGALSPVFIGSVLKYILALLRQVLGKAWQLVRAKL